MELLAAPLTFELPDGSATHAPMVEAEVAGIPMRLIVDTGASEHVLTVDLARRAGLGLEPDEPGTDAAGDPVPSWRAGHIPLIIAGATFSLEQVPVAEGPPPFAGWGIGGFLSPQGLHRSASVMLDLASDRLSLVDEPARVAAAALAERHPGLRPVTLERVRTDTTILVRTAIGEYPEVVTLIDSGARSTSFAAAVLPGITGGAEEVTGRGLGGREIRSPVVEGAVLHAGGASLRIGALHLTADRAGEVDGIVGMDLLRGTALVLSADPKTPVVWFVPR